MVMGKQCYELQVNAVHVNMTTLPVDFGQHASSSCVAWFLKEYSRFLQEYH